MIELTVIQFVVFGATCIVLGFIVAINLKLTAPKKREENDDIRRMKEYLKVHYRPRLNLYK